MGVRLYNPESGRFLSTDPVYGGNANTYTYPLDPVNMYDLDGRMAQVAVAIVGLAGLAVRAVLQVLATAVVLALVSYAVWHGTRAAAKKLGILYAKASKKSGKEKASDVPSWARGKKARPAESCPGGRKEDLP